MLTKIELLEDERLIKLYRLSRQYKYLYITPIWKYFYNQDRELDRIKINFANNKSMEAIQAYFTVKRQPRPSIYIAKSPKVEKQMYLLPVHNNFWHDDLIKDLNQKCVGVYEKYSGKVLNRKENLANQVQIRRGKEIYEKMVSEIQDKQFFDTSWINYSTGNEKELFTHQKEAVEFVMKRKYTLLDLITGSGKTLISLVCARNIQSQNPKPVLVVCEKKAIPMWQEECGSCQVEADYINYEQLVKRITRRRYGRGYQYLPNKDFNSNDYSAIIIDESHNLSNYTIAGRSLLAYTNNYDGYILSLTATPYKNTLMDYFYHFELLKHPVGSYSKTEFGLAVNPNDKPEIERFTELSKDLIITRTYADIGLNIPIKFIKVNIDLSPDDDFWDMYKDIQKNAKRLVIEKGGSKLVINNALMRLRKICAVAKKKYTERIVNNVINRKCVVISSYNEDVLDDLGNTFKTQVFKATNKDKENLYKDFVDGDSKVFLAQRRISETSLNLQVSDTLVYNDLWYSLSSFVQANGRIKRIGSKFDKLYIYIPIIKNTVEGSVYDILINKYEEREKIIMGLKGVEQKIKEAQNNTSAGNEIRDVFEKSLDRV